MKNKKKKRSRVAPTKKEDKVVSATKSEEANKTKRDRSCKSLHHNLPRKKKVQTKEKETVVVEAKAENTATPQA